MNTALIFTVSVSPLPHYHSIIDNSALGEASKAKYKREIDKLLRSGVNPSNQPALSAYAVTLPHTSRAVLKAALALLFKDTATQLEASANPENLSEVQSMLLNIKAMTQTIKVSKVKGKRMGMFLSAKQIEQLISLPDRSTVHGRRDWIVLAVLLDAGLRRSELANLTFSQIRRQPMKDGQMRCVLDILGKGKKHRTIPISPLLETRLKEWKQEAGDGYVVRAINKAGAINGSLSDRAIGDIVKKYGSFLDLPELDAHDLRRTWAQMGLANGVPLPQISVLLGHSSIAITQIYLDLEVNLDSSICDYIPLR